VKGIEALREEDMTVKPIQLYYKEEVQK